MSTIDAIVIGSGFGGSGTAARLAEAGVRIILLERGPRWNTVPTRSMGIGRRVQLPRGLRLVTRFVRSLNMPSLPRGRITTNRKGLVEFFYSPGLEVICSSGVGGGSHVYSAVHRRPLRDDYWDGHIEGLDEANMATHGAAFLARIGSTTPEAGNRPPNNATERYHTDPNFEPSVANAKVRVGFLLPDDPHQPKKVVAVSRSAEAGGRYRVDFTDHRRRRRESMHADNVIVAAGTMNTLRILLHNRDRVGCPAGMPHLGRRFSGNGDMRGFWDLNEPGSGLTTRLPSIDSYPIQRRMRERLKRGIVVASMGIDAIDGVIGLSDGKLVIDFDPANSPVYQRIYDTIQEMARRSGRKVYVRRRPSTVHPMGGACVGDAAAGGVVDAAGEVHDNPGLFVADAAALPAPTGAPPTQAIATWAENVAARFVDGAKE